MGGLLTLDSSMATGAPAKLDPISEYAIDPDNGLITQHRLLATHMNVPSTHGAVLSRWIQPFLTPEDINDAFTNGYGAFLKAFRMPLNGFGP
jgi:hypothetical protein